MDGLFAANTGFCLVEASDEDLASGQKADENQLIGHGEESGGRAERFKEAGFTPTQTATPPHPFAKKYTKIYKK